jgi:hypothetical protein
MNHLSCVFAQSVGELVQKDYVKLKVNVTFFPVGKESNVPR